MLHTQVLIHGTLAAPGHQHMLIHFHRVHGWASNLSAAAQGKQAATDWVPPVKAYQQNQEQTWKGSHEKQMVGAMKGQLVIKAGHRMQKK